ncbi:BTAD domain-containing putative transcriptional regulator [Kribbella sp. DT2]|uniref:AfsR/SARP family transcriptional regulator n=1 Tax=Kribbella sp. DT2 TaxID=3393427 RepID=UPI003CF02CAF
MDRLTLLGPPGLRAGNDELDLGSPQQQAVLTMLWATNGSFVSSAALVDGLWGEHAPPTGETVVRTYISRLRRVLPGPVITFQSGSYALDASRFVVDATEFAELIKTARRERGAGELAAAAETLETALDLWTGTALAGVPGEAAERERFRLEQLKLSAAKELLECRLELGQPAEVVAEVPLWIQLHPLEESLYEIYLLALYRCGRRAEALEVYRMLYDLLWKELGVRPGGGVQGIHERILRAEGELDEVTGALGRGEVAGALGPGGGVPVVGSASVRTGRRYVGRAVERAAFRALLDSDEPAVMVLCGPTGIGKSALLRQLFEDAQALGRQAWWLTDDLVEDLSTVTAPVVMIDSPAPPETWLPKLPSDSVVVIASTGEPGIGWLSGSWAVHRLEGLSTAEATELVEARGVDPGTRDAIVNFADGNPFALTLAAEVSLSSTGQGSRRDAARYVVDTVVAVLAGEVPSALHRRALHVCAHARNTTEDLLREVLPDGDSAELFDWLRSHPSVESVSYGLEINGVLREALDDHLHWRDLAGYARMHQQIRRYVLGKVLRESVTPYAGVEAVRTIGHLCRAGGISSRYVSWAGGNDLETGKAVPAELVALARKLHGDAVARSVRFWLDRQPEAFHVLRCRRTGRLRGFMSWLTLKGPESDGDPELALIWRDLHERMELPPGAHIGVLRHVVCPAGESGPSPVLDAIHARMLRAWLHEAGLAASYVVTTDATSWRGAMRYLGQYELAGAELPAVIFGHDWLAEPPEKWLEQYLDEPRGIEPGLDL